MRSPVFSKALGECNAITSRGFDPSELIFASALEPEVGASISAFLDEFRAANRRVTAMWEHQPKGPGPGGNSLPPQVGKRGGDAVRVQGYADPSNAFRLNFPCDRPGTG